SRCSSSPPTPSRPSASASRSRPSACARTASSIRRSRKRIPGPIRTRRRRCHSSSPSRADTLGRPGNRPPLWPAEPDLMLVYILKRWLWMIPSLFAVSFLAFVLIQLPPGDFVTNYIATLAASNEVVDQNAAAALRERFGLGDPLLVQYGKWIWGILSRG